MLTDAFDGWIASAPTWLLTVSMVVGMTWIVVTIGGAIWASRKIGWRALLGAIPALIIGLALVDPAKVMPVLLPLVDALWAIAAGLFGWLGALITGK